MGSEARDQRTRTNHIVTMHLTTRLDINHHDVSTSDHPP
jgi:hypothetical protein